MIHTGKGDYTLKYTYNALCAYEEKYSRSLLPDTRNAGFATLRGIVWAGLLHLNPARPMTEEQVGELMEDAIEHGMDVIDIREEINRAIEDATFMQRLTEKTKARMASSREKVSAKNSGN